MGGPDVELEERLRRLVSAFKEGLEPPATLHVSVMASTAVPRPPARRASIVRELSLAAALLAFVALLAFGVSRLHSLTPGPVKHSPSPSPVSRVIPWIATEAAPLKAQPPKNTHPRPGGGGRSTHGQRHTPDPAAKRYPIRLSGAGPG